MQNPIGDRLKLARLSTSFTMYIVKFIQATQSTTYISVVRSGLCEQNYYVHRPDAETLYYAQHKGYNVRSRLRCYDVRSNLHALKGSADEKSQMFLARKH
jgi:hypothetical protein